MSVHVFSHSDYLSISTILLYKLGCEIPFLYVYKLIGTANFTNKIFVSLKELSIFFIKDFILFHINLT